MGSGPISKLLLVMSTKELDFSSRAQLSTSVAFQDSFDDRLRLAEPAQEKAAGSNLEVKQETGS